MAAGNLGYNALARGDRVRARALCEEALVLDKEAGDRERMILDLTNLGYVALEDGRGGDAETFLTETIELARALDQEELAVAALPGLAALAEKHGEPERAVRLLAAAHALRDAAGTSLELLEQRINERVLRTTRLTLGETAFAALWDEGVRLNDGLPLQ